jgi:hypothetical protein
MDFESYRPLALRTAKMFPTQRENLRHAVLGLITEIGELTSEVKRIAIYNKPMTEEMRLHMCEEAGDAFWYIPLAMFALGINKLDVEDCGPLPNELSEVCLECAHLVGSFAEEFLAEHMLSHVYCETLLNYLVYNIDHGIAPLLGTTGDKLRAENIEKLRLRYPDKYSDAAAEARADKSGTNHTKS